MWFHVLACDYDGTLATAGAMAPETTAALRRVRESGRRVLLLTGRRLDDLLTTCPEIDCFDLVVAENGAVLFEPAAKKADALADPPPPVFLDALARLGVPFSTGRLPPECSFRFRGPHGALDLVAHSLETFTMLAKGVDDATWLHHLGNGDITGWLRGQIKDAGLADEVEALAQGRDAAGTRRSVLEAIARRYAPVARADEERRSD